MISEIIAGVIGYRFVKRSIDEARAAPREDDGIASDPSISERYIRFYGIDPVTGPEVEGEPVE